jgi:hypothetical protein
VNETVHLLVHELADSWTGKHQRDARLGLIALLEQHTAAATSTDWSEFNGGGAKVTGSPAPWAADIEMLLSDIDAGARHLEMELCSVLRWDTIKRGGSRNNTIAALHRVPALVDQLEAEQPGHSLVRGEPSKQGGFRCGQVQKQLSTWHRQARVMLGVEPPSSLLPFACTADGCGEKALRQRYGGVKCGACGEVYTNEELHEWFLPAGETA